MTGWVWGKPAALWLLKHLNIFTLIESLYWLCCLRVPASVSLISRGLIEIFSHITDSESDKDMIIHLVLIFLFKKWFTYKEQTEYQTEKCNPSTPEETRDKSSVLVILGFYSDSIKVSNLSYEIFFQVLNQVQLNNTGKWNHRCRSPRQLSLNFTPTGPGFSPKSRCGEKSNGPS